MFFLRRFSNEDDVTLKTVSPLRRVVRISAERRILRRILHNDELWDTKMSRRNSDSKRRAYILNEKLLFFFLFFSDIFQMHAGSRARTWSGGPIVGHQPQPST
ncbi:hypothetical protein AVEN_42316-1 [Araneus ventricosus]|uniref:Uncharacterized protein n=1 Tax=Araneus ventricosus TaxID=182803 RepID=A0A4Y2TNZ0_ARAVE|nr:hypothetical protein AVEN_42316-1 [Araneus ventricosus]